MKKEMIDLLTLLQFENITGTLYNHKSIGVISIKDIDTPTDLVKAIHQRGYKECQLDIKTALGVKDRF